MKNKRFIFLLFVWIIRKKVVITKAPSENNKNKKFLGYEWSSSKGNEGIKYFADTKTNIDIDTEEIDETDKQAIENIQNINRIITPLYNPKELNDHSKINSLIKDNFLNNEVNIPEDLSPFVSTARLIDMIDFSKIDFNSAISLSPKKNIDIKTKWELVKLGEICEIKIGGTPSRGISEYFNGSNLWVSIKEMKGNTIFDTKEKISDEGIKNSNVKLIPKGTTLLSFKLSIGKTAVAGKDLYTNEAIAGLIIKDKNKLTNQFLFSLFDSNSIDLSKDGMNTFGKSLNSAFLKDSVKIPLPPKEVQQTIVKECEAIDSKVEEATTQITKHKQEIENIIKSVKGEQKKLGDLGKVSMCKRIYKEQTYQEGEIPFYKIGTFGKQPNAYITKELYEEYKLKYSFPKIGDILISASGTIGKKVIYNGSPAYFQDSNIVWIDNNEKLVINKYLYHFYEYCNWGASKGSTIDRLYNDDLRNIKITIPPKEEQEEIVAKIENIEQKISKAQEILNTAKEKKQEVLERYL